MSGIDATAQIKRLFPKMEIIILSTYEDDDNMFRAICAGASGYVTKAGTPQELLDAIIHATSGGAPMSPHIARKVLGMFRQNSPPQKSDYKLTQRENEVLEKLVQGDDCKTIAQKMFVSVCTVRAHIRNIYEKLHVHSLRKQFQKR
jgi:DNA-binding NarL/FixJ family response regulator